MEINAAFDFTGRMVLVVGASRGGIGSAIAAGFTECGALVRITGAEPEPVAQDQGRYPYTQLDVADPGAVQRLADSVPTLDVLVNCAGIARRDEEYDPVVFARVLDVNLRGVLHLANAFQKHLVASQGSMINIASMYSIFGSPRVPAYGASKAGVAQLTKSLALAWAGQAEKQLGQQTQGRAKRLAEILTHFMPLARQVIAQATRRIVQGEAIGTLVKE